MKFDREVRAWATPGSRTSTILEPSTTCISVAPRRDGELRASSLRNPYKIDATRSRDEAIERFASEIFPVLVRDAASIGGRDLHALLARMRADEDLVLRCWCAPAGCHGDTIAAWLNANVET